MSLYTLITFRPAASDYCMGCFMSGTDAQFDIRQFETPEDVIDAMSKDMFKNRKAARDEGEIGFALWINGKLMLNTISNDVHPEPELDDAEVENTLAEVIWRKANAEAERLVDVETERLRQEEIRKKATSAARAKREQAYNTEVAQLRQKYQL